MTINVVLRNHQPWYDSFDQSADSWGCICNKQTGYLTAGEVVDKHIVPLVRAAALKEVTTKLKEIFEKSGMDLDAILKSEEAFGEPARGGRIYPSANPESYH